MRGELILILFLTPLIALFRADPNGSRFLMNRDGLKKEWNGVSRPPLDLLAESGRITLVDFADNGKSFRTTLSFADTATFRLKQNIF